MEVTGSTPKKFPNHPHTKIILPNNHLMKKYQIKAPPYPNTKNVATSKQVSLHVGCSGLKMSPKK